MLFKSGRRSAEERSALENLADIVAVPGDPLQDFHLLPHAKFVMKNGVIVKNQR